MRRSRRRISSSGCWDTRSRGSSWSPTPGSEPTTSSRPSSWGRRPWWCRRDGPPRPAAAGASAKRRSPGWRAGPPARPGPRPGPGRSDPVPDRPGGQPRRDRAPDHPGLPKARDPSGRGVLGGGRRRAPRPGGRPGAADRSGARARELSLDRARGGGGPGRPGRTPSTRGTDSCRRTGASPRPAGRPASPSWARLPTCCGRWARRRRRAGSSPARACRCCPGPTVPSRAPGRRARSPMRSAIRSC